MTDLDYGPVISVILVNFAKKNSVFGVFDTPKTPYGVVRLKSAP